MIVLPGDLTSAENKLVALGIAERFWGRGREVLFLEDHGGSPLYGRFRTVAQRACRHAEALVVENLGLAVLLATCGVFSRVLLLAREVDWAPARPFFTTRGSGVRVVEKILAVEPSGRGAALAYELDDVVWD